MQEQPIQVGTGELERYASMNRSQNRARASIGSVYRYGAVLLVPIWIGLFLPLPWTAVSVVAALVYFAVRWAAVGSPMPATKLTLPVLTLLAMSMFSLAFSPAPDLGLVPMAQLIAGLGVLFVTVDQVELTAKPENAAVMLALFGVGLALAAPFTVNWSPDKVFPIPLFYNLTFPRLPDPTNANVMAGALAPIVPITLALLTGHGRGQRALSGLALVLILLALVLLQSRGALFALAAGLAVWATLNRRWLLPLIPFGLLAALAVNNAYGGPSPAQFFYGKIGTPTGGTLVERQGLWTQAIFLIRQSPLVGIGPGAYPRVAPNAPLYPQDAKGVVFQHAHNLFFQVALDSGIIGLAAFSVSLLFAFIAASRAYLARIERPLAIGLIAALVVVVVHGLGDVVIWDAKSSVVLWVLFGLAMGLDKILHKVEGVL